MTEPTKHTPWTPGPWTLYEDACAHCGGEWGFLEVQQGAHAPFAKKADAQLAAAAPEMAAALERLLHFANSASEIFGANPSTSEREAIRAARAALAKALGETP